MPLRWAFACIWQSHTHTIAICLLTLPVTVALANSHTYPFKGPLSRTTRVNRYQKGKINLDFTEARDSEWQWHQLGHMQVCTSLQTDNHASTSPLLFFCRPDALSAAQPTVSKHWRQIHKWNKKMTAGQIRNMWISYILSCQWLRPVHSEYVVALFCRSTPKI